MSNLQKVCAIVAAWQLGACGRVIGIEDLPEPAPDAMAPADASPTYVLHGTVVGLLTSVSLRMEYPGGAELLTLDANGPFAFQTPLAEGASFNVTFVGDPPCSLQGGAGVVEHGAPFVAVECERTALAGLAISGPVSPALNFKPLRQDYEVQVSLLQQTMQITATAVSPEAMIAIDGVLVESGVPSETIPLAPGDNLIDVVVSGPGGEQRVYHLNVERTRAPIQLAYAKSNAPAQGAMFGISAAVWGDTIAVGTYFDGESQILRGHRGAWVQEAHLEMESGPVWTNVALWEDTLVLGSSNAEISGMERRGRVSVYQRQGNTWRIDDHPEPPNLEAGDRFGASVGLWADTIAIGVAGEDSSATGIDGDESDNGAEHSGAVHVFDRTGRISNTPWERVAYLKASNTGAEDDFGTSVALWGDLLAVGAPEEDSAASGVNGNQGSDGSADSGAVYVFRRTGASWEQEAYLKASNTGAGDRFGHSLALWGDILVIGAPEEDSAATGVNGDQDNNDSADSGAVYVFRRIGTSWVQQAYLKASNTRSVSQFGRSVAVWGDMIAVGAFWESGGSAGVDGDQADQSKPKSGAVYLFQHTDGSWSQTSYIKASNPDGYRDPYLGGTSDDEFGGSVALWDGTLVCGAHWEDSGAVGVNGDQSDNSVLNSGAVYIFH